MALPRIDFLFSTSEGDRAITAAELAHPLLLSPGKSHPFLTLGDLLSGAADFLLRQHPDQTRLALEAIAGRTIPWDDIGSIAIRSEKQGALYQIASVEFHPLPGRPPCPRLALTSALTPDASACLAHEFGLLQALGQRRQGHRLQRVFFAGEVPLGKAGGEPQARFVCGEWIIGHHEWHVSRAPGTDEQVFVLWDTNRGHRRLEPFQTHELFRQAAFILTSFFDPGNGREITPWHHAAGDFIVRTDGGVGVRLVTVRDFRPVVEIPGGGEAIPVRLLLFLIHLTVRMRLDKVDGVGQPAWLNEGVIAPTLEGFLTALHDRAAHGETLPLSPEGFLALCRMFPAPDLLTTASPLLAAYQHEAASDATLIASRWEAHMHELANVLAHVTLHPPQQKGDPHG